MTRPEYAEYRRAADSLTSASTCRNAVRWVQLSPLRCMVQRGEAHSRQVRIRKEWDRPIAPIPSMEHAWSAQLQRQMDSQERIGSALADKRAIA